MAMLSERVLGCGPKEYEHLKAEIQRTLRVANPEPDQEDAGAGAAVAGLF